jgi:hypothetical protein
MPRPTDEMDDLKRMCPGVQEMIESGVEYIFLPELKHPCAPGTLDALLCPQQHSSGSYPTRLFLSVPIGKWPNWSTHTILSRTWHTWSWNNVPASQRLAEILAQHLGAFR